MKKYIFLFCLFSILGCSFTLDATKTASVIVVPLIARNVFPLHKKAEYEVKCDRVWWAEDLEEANKIRDRLEKEFNQQCEVNLIVKETDEESDTIQ